MSPLDVPSIVSGDRIVYLDPQETIWPGDPGQCYSLSLLRGTDMLVPFSGIEEFDHTITIDYPKTLFRFPLRVLVLAVASHFKVHIFIYTHTQDPPPS